MFEIRDMLLFGILAGVLAAVALAFWPWSRQRPRFVVGGIGTSVGFIVWNLILVATGLDLFVL